MSSSLIIDGVGQNDTGHYTCLAENIQGIGESPSVFVQVLYTPECKDKRIMNVDASMHESVDLSCEMDSNPGNLTFQWFLYTKVGTGPEVRVVEIPFTQFTQHERKSVLTLTPRTPGDYGRVSCTAWNSIGKGSSCHYIVNKKVCN